MALVNIMGMLFNENEVPDFGSIELTSSEHLPKKEYLIESKDIDKLDKITNAGAGSTALCTDTWDLYEKHLGKWKKVGDKVD